MTGLCEQRANLGISVIARKIGPSDRRLAWDVDVRRDPGYELPVAGMTACHAKEYSLEPRSHGSTTAPAK